MLRQVIAIGCVLAATAARAEPVRLSNEGIKATVAGSVLHIDTPLGTKLPVRYSEDGKLAGRAGGMVANYLGARSDSGRWWVSKNRLCHKWKRWFEGKLQCLRLRKAGRRVLWRRDDGKTGTATIASRSTPAAKPEARPYALGYTQPERKEPDTERFLPLRRAAPAAPSPATPEAQPPNALPPRLARAPQPSEANSVAEKPAFDEPSFRVAGVEAYDVLNIRSGPSTGHGVVGAIPPNGRGVKIIGACVQYWCPINHRGTNGWVNRIYLAEEMPAPGSAVRASHWFRTSQAR